MATIKSPSNRPKAEQVRSYLLREASENGDYYKSRFIAEDLELTAKEIGSAIHKLQSDCSQLDIEKWSYTNGTTWRVTLCSE